MAGSAVINNPLLLTLSSHSQTQSKFRTLVDNSLSLSPSLFFRTVFVCWFLTEKMAIPVIDFSKLYGEERAKTLAQIANACEVWGFFQVLYFFFPFFPPMISTFFFWGD